MQYSIINTKRKRLTLNYAKIHVRHFMSHNALSSPSVLEGLEMYDHLFKQSDDFRALFGAEK